MISLSVQDTFDGSHKIADLRRAVGQEFSDNYSSTCRSVLVHVSKDGNTCTTKEVPSPYKSGNQTPKPGLKIQPSWLVWNAMFF